MKMFVTRLGFNSKAVITGDITQIDLPTARRSGLLEAIDILKNVEGLTFVYFDEADVVRHHLVQRIIRAYDEQKPKQDTQMSLELSAVNGAPPQQPASSELILPENGFTAGEGNGRSKLPAED
jgi:phosphate starvation-inducible PhoH-like protein